MATSVPPHNVAELLDAALYLISHPEAETEALLQFAPGPDFPTGGIVVDDRASIAETYRTGRGVVSAARALGQGRHRARRLGRGRHGNSVRRAEGAADRAARRAVQREEGAAARRRPRRIDRGRSHRARAPRAQRRAGRHDGAALQAQRAGDAHFRQHERAGRRRHAARDRARRSVAAMARPSPRRAAAALEAPVGGDRATARTRRRHDHRLPQSGRGDPHHPRARRAEERADGAVRTERRPGQLHPRHAAARAPPARGDGAAQGTDRSDRGEGPDRGDARLRQEAMADHRPRDPRHQEEIRAGDARSASGAPPSRRPPNVVSISPNP